MSASSALDPARPAAQRPAPPLLDNCDSALVHPLSTGRDTNVFEHLSPSEAGPSTLRRKRPRSTTAPVPAVDDPDDASEPATRPANLVSTPLAEAGPSRSAAASVQAIVELESVIGSGRLSWRQQPPAAMAAGAGTSAAVEELRLKRRRSETYLEDDESDVENPEELSNRVRATATRSTSRSDSSRRSLPRSPIEPDGDHSAPMDIDPPNESMQFDSWSTSPGGESSSSAYVSRNSTGSTRIRLPAPSRVQYNSTPLRTTDASTTAHTASAHATSSSYRSILSSSTALPLSMRRRPPLVRNATAVPAPLTPAISQPGGPAEDDLSYFQPTPPPSSRPADHAIDRSSYVQRFFEDSPTSGSSFAAGVRAVGAQGLPRRPGAMDASGRLRGPSRSANESWLGIRRSPSPPAVGLTTSAAHGRFSPPITPVTESSSGSSGRSSARAWAPIGRNGNYTRSLNSPGLTPDAWVQPRRLASPSAGGSEATLSTPAAPLGLRPFRLRPQAVRPLQPITTSPTTSTTARRTSLLAQLGSANEAEEALGSDFQASFGFSRPRSEGVHGGTEARRRRTTARPNSLSVSEPTASTSEDQSWSSGPTLGATRAPSPPPFSAFRPLLLGGEGSRYQPTQPVVAPLPTLSFIRPLQLPLSNSVNEAQTPPVGLSSLVPSAPRHSQLAPPVLTAAFNNFGDDSDSEWSPSDSGDPPSMVDPRPAQLSPLTPQTRLPVMLASGSRLDAGHANASSPRPSFASTHASDWSSSPSTHGAAHSVRRVPTLRPYRSADHGFSNRSASIPATPTSRNAAATPALHRPSAFSTSTPSTFPATFGSNHARTSLSSEQASTSTAGAGSGEQPYGAGSRLAEYLSRHGERRRRLLPGLVDDEERDSERHDDDDWTGSLLDWFSARPNSSVDPAEIQEAEELLATRRRRLNELRRARLSATPLTGGEPSSDLARTLDALGARTDGDEAPEPPVAPLPASSIWDALLYPSPSASVPHPATAQTTSASMRPAMTPVPPIASAASQPGTPGMRSSREAFLEELLRQISADLSSLSRPPAHASTSSPLSFHPERLGFLRRRDGSGWTSTTSSGQQHSPPMTLGLGSLFSSLASPASTSLGTDFLTEDEIDFSYESLIELSARLPAVVRATPDWVIEGLPVCSYRDQVLKVTAKDVDQRCAICLDEYLSHDLTMTPPCGHFLHKGCLEEWLRSSHICPLCRADVVPISDRPVEPAVGMRSALSPVL